MKRQRAPVGAGAAFDGRGGQTVGEQSLYYLIRDFGVEAEQLKPIATP